METPYQLLTEAQKAARRAAKKRWRDKNPEKQRALTIAWQRRNRDRIKKAHLESKFTDGMTWGKFFGGGIHIDHVIPRMNFTYSSPNDPQFKQCWALSNLRPIWPKENSVSGANARWKQPKRTI